LIDDDEKDYLKQALGQDYDYTEVLNIPLILHAPGVTYPSEVKTGGAQIDILPTVANLLGVSVKNQIHFGSDLLNETTSLIPMRHFLPEGSFLNSTHLYIPGIDYADGTSYSMEDNSESTTASTEEQYNNVLKLVQMSDSFVKQLPEKSATDYPKNAVEQ
jgi:phosphoglycerol transferase MdoB-like AlkP superfamily enzyme